MMTYLEFLPRRTDGDYFDLPFAAWTQVLHPNSFSYQRLSGKGEYCIDVDSRVMEINYEIVGFQIVFHGESEHTKALQIVNEILENITKFTGQAGEVVDLNGDLAGKVIHFE